MIDAGTWLVDADGDGFTSAVSTTASAPCGGDAEATEQDCDDGDASSIMGGDELLGDGTDQDRDGADAIGDDAEPPVGDTDDEQDLLTGCTCVSTGSPRAGWPLVLGLALGVRRRMLSCRTSA